MKPTAVSEFLKKKIGIVETKIYSIRNVPVIVLQELVENTCIINRCKKTKQARKIDIYFKSPPTPTLLTNRTTRQKRLTSEMFCCCAYTFQQSINIASQPLKKKTKKQNS